jgi:hypothetical protein
MGVLNMNIAERAYCAGIVDGEGTISISANSQQTKIRKDGKIKITKQVSKVIRVANTDLRLLEWLAKITGYGKVTKLYQNPNTKYDRFRKGNIKPLYSWAIFGFNIKSFLVEIIPYLVIKKRHAELMLESINLSWKRGRGNGYSPEVWEKQLSIISEIRTLNKRGINI